MAEASAVDSAVADTPPAANRSVAPSRLTIATVVVAMVVGVLGGWLVFGRASPGTDSVEAGFARDMSEHHAQAVDMSLIALQASDRRDIDVLAYDIATTQSTQIGTMKGWLDQWDVSSTRSGSRMEWMSSDAMSTMPGMGSAEGMAGMDGVAGADGLPAARPGDPDYRAMPGMATNAQMEQLRGATSTEAEVLFLQLMITHHLAGAAMAQAAVDEAKTPEVVQLASAMVNGQRSEITLMTDLLAERGAAPQESM